MTIGGNRRSFSLRALVFCATLILHDTNYDVPYETGSYLVVSRTSVKELFQLVFLPKSKLFIII